MMDYRSYANGLIGRLKGKGYMLVEAEPPLDFALMKRGALMQTYVVGVYSAFSGSNEPNDVLQRTRRWFHSIYGNNGGGLLLLVYPEVPAWALDQVKNFSGEVVGGAIDLNNNRQWVSGHLGWAQEVGAA